MFRKIKKLYFKIYHLFKLLGVFILVFGIIEKVNAMEIIAYQTEFKVSEESCTNNLMNPTFIAGARLRNGQQAYSSCTTCYASQLIKVKPSTEYIINTSRGVASMAISGLDTTTSSISLTTLSTTGGTYTTGSNTNYIVMYMTSNSWGDISTFEVKMNEGQEVTTDEFETECSPPEPPAPEKDEVYSDFIGLYINKMQYMAIGFTTNPYLIAMIGIIIAWVVLELFLRILNLKGGRRK